MIYTFYSYKGGVGRSMALANLAKWFYLRGLRVVVIDWDLEAPGLENFFYSQQETEQLEQVHTQLGLIDMLLAYKRQFPLLPQPVSHTAQNGVQTDGQIELSMADVLNKYLPPLSGMLYRVEPHLPGSTKSLDNGALWLLPAGWRSGDRLSAYVQAVQDFDWSDFYVHFAGHAYFDWLREQLSACADIVLIDSRTGVTEMSGVSTQHLADVVVSLCAPNIQNLQGVFSMARSFKRPEVLQARGEDHPLEVIVVPARIDSSELAYRNAFEKRFKTLFDNDEFTPAVFRRFQHTLWDLCIPYVAQYSYTDKLVVGDDEGAAELKKAYDELAVHMVMLTPEKHILRQRCASDLELVFQKLSPGLQKLLRRPLNIFISCALEDADFVREVRRRLELDYPDIIIHNVPLHFALQEGGSQQLSTAFDTAQSMLVIVTSAALRSPQLRREWRYARQRGICVYPLVVKQFLDQDTLPNWMRKDYYEYNKRYSWQSLIAQLRGPCRARAIPSMAPSLPAGFVERVSEQRALLETTLRVQSMEPPLDIIALHGPAGAGKTILASALCQDETVQDIFEDGILWVTLGVEPSNVIGKIEDLLYILGEEKLSFNSIEAATAALTRLLEDRKLLLIIDDVWKKTDLKPFLQGGKQCVRLITTRDASVISRKAKRIKVEAMNVSEARQMLLTNIDLEEEPDSGDQENVEDLIARLDYWPLLLELANITLQQRLAGKDSLTGAMHYLSRALNNQGIVAFDQYDISERNQSIAASIELSLQQLKVDERQFCQQLANFTPYDVPLSQLNTLSKKMSPFDIEELVDRLDTLALLTIDYDRGRVSLYKVICDYLLTKLRR